MGSRTKGGDYKKSCRGNTCFMGNDTVERNFILFSFRKSKERMETLNYLLTS